jgi:uncharacterized membrane protein
MNGTQGTETGTSGIADLPESIAAMLAAVLPPISGITFYLLDKTRPLVRFYALQNILLGIAAAVGCMSVIVLGILSGTTAKIPVVGTLLGLLGGLLATSIGVVYIVLIAFQVFKAWKSVEWEIPGLGPSVRNLLAKN